MKRCWTMKGSILFVFILLSCASVHQYSRMDAFDKASRAYEKSIEWSNFDNAATFLPNSNEATPPVDLESYKQIRVTSYRIKQFQAAPDASEVRQEIEIGYYRINDMRLKTIRDRQHWTYDTDQGRWMIRSGLPDFN